MSGVTGSRDVSYGSGNEGGGGNLLAGRPAAAPTASRTLTVHLPMTLRKRGGRKIVMATDGSLGDALDRRAPHIDSALLKALARAFRWRKLIETGTYATVAEIAAAESLNPSYVSRVLRLTLLAPDLVEAILNRRQAAGITLAALMRPFPPQWSKQRGQESISPANLPATSRLFDKGSAN